MKNVSLSKLLKLSSIIISILLYVRPSPSKCPSEQDTKLELSVGNRYGLIGANGCGKSALLAVLGNREVPIQEHVDIYYLGKFGLNLS